MANKFVTAIFGDYSKKEVKRVKKTADKVLALEDKYAAMSDKELTSQTVILKGNASFREHAKRLHGKLQMHPAKYRQVFRRLQACP